MKLIQLPLCVLQHLANSVDTFCRALVLREILVDSNLTLAEVGDMMSLERYHKLVSNDTVSAQQR